MFFQRVSRGERRGAHRWYGPLSWTPARHTARGEPVLPRGTTPAGAGGGRRRGDGVAPGAAPGRGRPPGADRHRGVRVPGLRPDQPRAAAPSCWRTRRYGPIVERRARRGLGDRRRRRSGGRSTWPRGSRRGRRRPWQTFAEDVATIVAMELAQLALLEEFFEVPVREARLSFGYSIGELSAMVVGGVFTLEQLLPDPARLSPTIARRWPPTRRWACSSRGARRCTLEDVQALCTAVSSEGHGLIGPSAYLSPNTVLVIGQGDTLDRLETADARVTCPPRRYSAPQAEPAGRRCTRRSSGSGTSRTGRPMALYTIGGRPAAADADGRLVRHRHGELRRVQQPATLLIRWIDHPQRLWDVIDETLVAGVDLVIHVGPAPNLIPATFERLSNNVAQTARQPLPVR